VTSCRIRERRGVLLAAFSATACESYSGGRSPGDVSHSLIWAANSACRALRIISSRTAPGGSNLASARPVSCPSAPAKARTSARYFSPEPPSCGSSDRRATKGPEASLLGLIRLFDGRFDQGDQNAVRGMRPAPNYIRMRTVAAVTGNAARSVLPIPSVSVLSAVGGQVHANPFIV
jgi:hypothetical protein